jgi:hypothetical protein
LDECCTSNEMIESSLQSLACFKWTDHEGTWSEHEFSMLQKMIQKRKASIRQSLTKFLAGETERDKTKESNFLFQLQTLSEQNWNWLDMKNSVGWLQPDMLIHPTKNPNHLSLHPRTIPTWVDQLDELRMLRKQLEDLSVWCIAIDTEWFHSKDGETHISTLQLAACLGEDTTILTWIVDLQSNEVQTHAANFVKWLLRDSTTPILGFAIGHDLHKLDGFIAKYGSSKTAPIERRALLDLQPLANAAMSGSSSHLPGLKACCSHFISRDYILNKSEQCSDWAQRPLTESQMEYAALDVAVLFYLLASLPI